MANGIVKFVNARPFGGKTLHSFKLENDPLLYALGEKPAAVQVGDYVTFEHGSVSNGRANVDPNKITVSNSAPAPSAASAPWASRTQSIQDKDAYWRAKEARDIASEPIIRKQAARRDAISLVCTMVEKDLVKLPEKGKMEAVLGLVNDIEAGFLDALEVKKEEVLV